MSEKITVIGAGTMGSGIAQVAVEAGFVVNLVDTEQAFVDRGIQSIGRFIGKKVEKGKLTQAQRDDILSRLIGTTDMKKAVEGAVMVVEAVFEKFELKRDIFQKLDALCPPSVILASNTSTLSIANLRRRHEEPGEGHRHSLLQPRSGDAARGGYQRERNQRRNGRQDR